MFARALFPTDLSAYANAILDCLPELKAAGLSQVVLLTVIRPSDVPMGHTQCRQVCRQMFARVLHPTDFSDCANAAFNLVKRLKAAGTEQVTLLHVQDARGMRHQPAEQLAEFDRKGAERLERMRRDLTLYGLSIQTVVRHGIPFREILKVADEEDASLIVLGLCGRGAWQEMLAGGRFEKVVRQSRRPVLVVRQQVSAQAQV